MFTGSSSILLSFPRSCSVFHHFSSMFYYFSLPTIFLPFSHHFPPSFALFLALTSPAGGPGLHRPRDDQRPSGAGHVGRGQRTGAEHRPGLHGVLQPSLVTIGEAIGFMRSTIVSYISLNYSIVLYININIYILILYYIVDYSIGIINSVSYIIVVDHCIYDILYCIIL